MLSTYLNQTATYEKKTLNESGDSVTEATSIIKCRKSFRNTLIRNSQGEQVVSKAVYYHKEPNVNVGDFLDGKQIIDVSAHITFGGTELYYRCYL